MALVTGSWLQDALLLTTTVLLLVHWYISSSYSYFKDRGIPFLKPLPFLGMLETWTKSQHALSNILYHSFPGERFFGYFQAKTPILVVKDPELLYRIMVKDFAHFHDRGFPFVESDPLNRNLFNLKGDTWRALRLKLIPTFTTGKLKNMFDQLDKCADRLVEDVEKATASGEAVDARPFTMKFTGEVIGNIAFGLDFSSTSPQGIEFNERVQEVFLFSYKQVLVFFLLATVPKLTNWLKLSFLNKSAADYFVNMAKQTRDYRKKSGIKRNDYFQLLLTLQEAEEKGQNMTVTSADHSEEDTLINQMDYVPQTSQPEVKTKLFTDECVTAQSFVFFTAGSDSVSSTMSFVLYHIAKDPKIQARLEEEVKDALIKHSGWSYQAVKEMTFLDEVIQEAQRMYPIVALLMRECSEPYHIPDSNIVIEKGTKIAIPVSGLQMDPKYFNSPQEFNPDRFSGNNHKPSPTFMPFGDGPRICIAMRFAILEMKVCLAKIVSQYSVHINSKTKEPFEFERKSFFPRPVGGIWIDFKKRPTAPMNGLNLNASTNHC